MKFMEHAIEEAKKAYNENEIPVGCIITHNGMVIASEHNTTMQNSDATCHAEINAIKSASEFLGERYLTECEMYVTLEPCPMCAGAIINSKIKRLYIGADEPKSGCFGSVADFTKIHFNHKPEVYYGICEDKCADILKDFFSKLR